MSTDGTGRQSPLSAFFATAAGDAADGAAVVISERPFLGHLNLRGDPGNGGFTSAAAGVLGFALPTEPNTTAGKGGLLALWLGPDEWLVVTPPDAQTSACGLPRSRAPGRPRLGHRRDRRPDRDNAERPKRPRRPGERLPARPPPRGLRPRRLRPDPARQGQRDHPMRRRLAVASSSSSAAASPSTPRSGSTTPRWNTGAPSSVRGSTRRLVPTPFRRS